MFDSSKKTKSIYLEEISLENVKCFGPKQTIKFSENGKPKMWNMILGDNGTGKSTILKSIVLAIEYDIKNSIERFEFFRTYSTKGNICLNVLEEDGIIIFNFMKSSEGDKYNLHIQPQLRNVNIPIFGYGSYRRLGKKGFSNTELPFQSASLFDDGIELINAEDWLLRADYENMKSEQKDNEVDRVKNMLLSIFREEVSDISINKTKLGFGVEFETRYGWVNIKNLSTGYKSLITWMVDLANWLDIYYPDSDNPLNEQAIVLVDEIDLHLHVSLQRELVSFLRETFPKIQFIVTAHSPLVVQGSEEENIIVLEKKNDHVVIKENPVNVKKWRIDQILTSDLFGLESSRSKTTEVKMNRRYELLKKDSLNQGEQEEMKELSNYIQEVPVNDKPEIDEASKIIQDAANVLKNLKKGKKQ